MVVYAKCTRVGRKNLWQGLEDTSSHLQGLWMVTSDFNVISAAKERIGGAPNNIRNMKEFNSCTFNCGLTVLSFDDNPFTWTNGRVW